MAKKVKDSNHGPGSGDGRFVVYSKQFNELIDDQATDDVNTSGDGSFGGDLSVTGDATITGNATVTGNLDVTGNLTVTGTSAVSRDTITGAGAIPITANLIAINTTGPDTPGAYTLADGVDGQIMYIFTQSVFPGTTADVTPTNTVGTWATVSLNAQGESVTLIFDATVGGWALLANYGGVIA
jgi:hypothetical protein